MRESHEPRDVPALTRAPRLPNLFLIGAKKAGTTSLFDYLGTHPDICPGQRKAVNYLRPDLSPWRHGRPPSLEAYASFWDHARSEPWLLEAPTTYLDRGTALAPRLEALAPDARVIVSLREPARRLWSEFRQKQRSDPARFASQDFGQFVDRAIDAHVGGTGDRGYNGFARGLYAGRLTPWFDAFGDRFHVLFMEQWSSEPQRVLGRVYSWLGLDPGLATVTRYAPRNQLHDLRAPRLRRAARSIWHRAARRAPGLESVRPTVRGLHDRLNRRPAAAHRPPAPVMARLEAAYSTPNEDLRSLLRDHGVTDLPPWLEARS